MNDLCADIGYKSINHYGEQLCGDHVDIIEQFYCRSACGRSRKRSEGKHSFHAHVKDNFNNDGGGTFA